ncbi:MAG: transposase [Candidatus Thiodiazotropha sp. (ex Epidulcina cf. delphinae)]|nr:transposase [Candidatus Thiodiazotropha sp. (ex Epidulcina cf. delphinae)]
MRRRILRDDQWARIAPLLSGKASDCGVTGKNNRQFIEAVLWICRTGAPWRDLPKELGNWHTVFTRYNRWSKKGRWQTIFEAQINQDTQYLHFKNLSYMESSRDRQVITSVSKTYRKSGLCLFETGSRH